MYIFITQVERERERERERSARGDREKMKVLWEMDKRNGRRSERE